MLAISRSLFAAGSVALAAVNAMRMHAGFAAVVFRRWVAAGFVAAALLAARGADTPSGLKDLHLETPLVMHGMPVAKIVVPKGSAFRTLGEKVQGAVKRVAGTDLEIVDAAAITDADCRKWNLILLGNLSTNPVVAKLYARHYCFTDAIYPGKGGYEARTIHNPLGWQRNSVLLGGSDPAGVERAVDAFIARLAAPGALIARMGDSFALQRWIASQSDMNPAQHPDDAFVQRRIRAITANLDNGNVRAQMGGIVEAGMYYYLTGEEGWGKIFRASLLHYYELAAPTGDWALIKLTNDPTGQYFWPWKVVLMWDNVEEGSVFSDADRLTITRLLFNISRWVAGCDIFDLKQPRGPLFGAPNEIRQGHATYASLSMFFCAEYFRMYYPELTELSPRYADVARIFDGQANSYKSNDNGTLYSPLAPQQYLCYVMTRGVLDEQVRHNLRALADSAVITTDNRRDAVTYGDTPGYIVGNPRNMPFLAKAAWCFDDAGYRGAFQWLAERSWSKASGDGPYGDTWYQGLYVTDGPAQLPERLLGIAPLHVDRGLYDYIRKRTAAHHYVPPPIEHCFDKMSFRSGYGPRDEYLLMSGISGVLVHGHEDGNAILRLTWNDRIWLANLGYRDFAPSEHNGLMVWRTGDSAKMQEFLGHNPDDADSDAAGLITPPTLMPAYSSLEAIGQLPRAGFTHTRTADYNGIDWDRTILWSKGRFFLVFDDVAARDHGHYQLALSWRGLGEAALSGNDFALRQDGEQFNIKSADDSDKNLSLKRPDRNSDWSGVEHDGFTRWPKYEHADGTVRILSEMKEINGRGRHRFANLLFPGAADSLVLEQVNDREVKILGPNGVIGLAGTGSVSNTGGDLIEADAYLLTADAIEVFGLRKISLRGFAMECDQPTALELDWKSGRGRISARESTRARVHVAAVELDHQAVEPDSKQNGGQFEIAAGEHEFAVPVHALHPLGAALDVPSISIPESKPAAQPEIQVTWERRLGTPVQKLVAGDIDGDGSSEIVVASGHEVTAWNADGTRRWQYRAPDQVLQLALDRLGGTHADVVVAAGSFVVRLAGTDGHELWRHDCTYMRGRLSAMTIADLGAGSGPTILAGNENSTLFALTPDGTQRWYSFRAIGRAGISALWAGEMNGDGTTRIFVGTSRDHGAVVLSDDGEHPGWRVFGTHRVAVGRVSPAGAQLLIGGPEGRGALRLVNAATGKTQALFPVIDDVTDALALPGAESRRAAFVAAFRTQGVLVLDEKGAVLTRMSFSSFPSTVALSPHAHADDETLAVAAQDGKVWATTLQGALLAMADLRSPVISVAFVAAQNETQLCAGLDDGRIVSLRWPKRAR